MLTLDLFPEFVASPRCLQSPVNHLCQPLCQQVHFGIIEIVGRQRGRPPSAGERPQHRAVGAAEDLRHQASFQWRAAPSSAWSVP
jgi:hypothetical protein